MRSLSASVLLALTPTLSILGCVDALPAGTTPTSAEPAPTQAEAVVTFVRPRSSCDTGEFAVVVNGRGDFIGDIASGTQLALQTTPGEHVYYAWSNIDAIAKGDENRKAVAAIRVTAKPGASTAIVFESVAPCREIDMHVVGERPAVQDELKGWLASTTPVTSDRAAGQVRLNSQPAHLATYLDLGAANLHSSEVAEARRERRDAVLREAQ